MVSKIKKIKHKFKFQGCDWTELCDFWNIKIPKDAYDEEERKPLIEFIQSHYDGYNDKYDEHIIEGCKSYLKALIKNDRCYSTPLWQGLLQIKDNTTFMQYFIWLLPSMWI